MPKKPMEQLTESMFYVLMALTGGEKCGIDIADYIDRRTSGRIRIGPATLYTILGKFEHEGYIRETAVEGRKRTYVMTDAGRRAYVAEVDRLCRCLGDAAHAEREENAQKEDAHA